MKFKVGDKVRVRSDLVGGKYYNHLCFNETMKSMRNKIYTIDKKIYSFYTENYVYKLKEDKNNFNFNDIMLVPVTEEKENAMEKFVIIRKDNKVTAKYYKGDNLVTAEAKCSPEDEFDFSIGAKLAMDRAVEKMKDEEVGYSFVRCVGYRQKDEFYFTVNKVYKIYDNGHFVSDNGFNYGGHNNDTKESVLKFLSDYYIFEEV